MTSAQAPSLSLSLSLSLDPELLVGSPLVVPALLLSLVSPLELLGSLLAALVDPALSLSEPP
ncbi:MAG: hypothetical protein IPK80_31400 [Nannocystis sp.]|nr:hypothetical protein [Nannocystis sp.]